MNPASLMTLVLLFASPGPADEAPEGAPEGGWQKLFARMAGEYRIEPAGVENPKPFVLHERAVLHWNQPVRGGDDGAVYLWLDQGRPAAIGAIFAWPDSDGLRVVTHEFHSLAAGPLQSNWEDRLNWQPARAGLEFRPIPGAPKPADSARQRMTQMRALLREFSGRSVDSKGKDWELRLLPKELFRSEPEPSDLVLDGALFAFAQGTDPEILVSIEARSKEAGAPPRWEFACARFSDLRLQFSHNEQEVWSSEPGGYSDSRGVYYAIAVERRKTPDDSAPQRLK